MGLENRRPQVHAGSNPAPSASAHSCLAADAAHRPPLYDPDSGVQRVRKVRTCIDERKTGYSDGISG